MDLKETHPWAWRVFLASLLAAGLAASWGALGGAGCRSCEGLSGTLGGRNLALLGALYYGALFVGAALLGPNPAVFAGVLIAAGIHAPLLALLVQAKLWCAPCLLAGLSALSAVISAMVLEPGNVFRGSILLPAAALALESWVVFSGGPLPAGKAEAREATPEESEGFQPPPVPEGWVRMVLYTRPDCGYCRELERDVLPGLLRDFGAALLVERRSAEALPGIPTPTIILTGHERRRLFPGLPPPTDLRAAIELVMGAQHDPETLSQKSR